MESTKELRNKLPEGKSKEVVDELYMKSGGIPKAQSSGQLPRDKQAYNIKKRLSTSGYLSAPVFATNATRDVLFSVMLQCKNAKTDRFVQEVTCAPEPMAVLCLEQQLPYFRE